MTGRCGRPRRPPSQTRGCGPATRARGAGERSRRSNEHAPACAHGSATHGGQMWTHSGADTARGSPRGREGPRRGRAEAASRGATGRGRAAAITPHSQGRKGKGRRRKPRGWRRARSAGPGARGPGGEGAGAGGRSLRRVAQEPRGASEPDLENRHEETPEAAGDRRRCSLRRRGRRCRRLPPRPAGPRDSGGNPSPRTLAVTCPSPGRHRRATAGSRWAPTAPGRAGARGNGWPAQLQASSARPAPRTRGGKGSPLPPRPRLPRWAGGQRLKQGRPQDVAPRTLALSSGSREQVGEAQTGRGTVLLTAPQAAVLRDSNGRRTKCHRGK